MDVFFIGHRHSHRAWIGRRAAAANAEPVRERRNRRTKQAPAAEGVVWAKDTATRERGERAHGYGLGSPAT